jgi:hypothetical protein
MKREFKSPKKNYQKGHFTTSQHPFSPSPKRSDYQEIALVKSDKHSRCTYIHPETNKRCKIKLGLYPQFCHLHTMLIDNLYISKSHIVNGGNGLFAGTMGFKEDDIIGEYSQKFNSVKQKRIDNRSENPNYSYVFCKNPKRGEKEEDSQCYDGLDARSTIIRNANDSHGSTFKNNAYFSVKKDHVYMLASKKISPFSEIFCNYGDSYF